MLRPADTHVVCFLQGPAGYFFRRLARELESRGARTLRVNLCAGDRLNWPGPSIPYRGPIEHWGGFIEAFLAESGATDLVLLGEQREYHRIAVERAHKLGIRVVVLELGYLRPDWLTLERDGMSGNSRFPRDPGLIRELARNLPAPDPVPRYSGSFASEAVADFSYHAANLVFRLFYPHYRSHLPGSPLLGDVGIGLHLLLARLSRRASDARVEALLAAEQPYFVFPLQIENDFQIRAYSRYGSIGEAIAEVMASFARQAPPQSLLVIKEHPREIAWLTWRRHCLRLAAELGIGKRFVHLVGGPLDALLAGAEGVVTINSTVGLQALFLGRPLKVLGQAVFDIPGLSSPESLDEFWDAPRPPERGLVDAFARLLAASVQVRGAFYSARGSKAAIEEIADRLLSGKINQPGV